MRIISLLSVPIAASLLFGHVYAKAVFAHYMVGTVTQDHAHQDIDDAKAMGLDGFALNIGDATQPYVDETLHDLFGYAEYVGGFWLYISMDVYASGAACYAGSTSCNGPYDYASIFDWTLASSAYYKGPNGFPMISTFSSGGFVNTTWQNWKNTLANQMYFIPDFDETAGYYGGEESYPGWYYYWGGVVDGLFSWESAWPKRGNPSPGTVGGLYPGDTSPDNTVQTGTIQYNKGYMMGLSSLQYKNSYGTNVFRQGDANLPTRMANILAMETAPGWIVVQTWNDGPESHYIGNLWPEQNTDTQPAAYMGALWDHTGWQPLIQSFITTYKAGGSQAAMLPPSSGGYIAGAIWYRTILTDATCINDDGGVDSQGAEQYYEKPDGFDSAQDVITWAIVMPEGAEDYSVSIFSGGTLLKTVALVTGLNYGSVASLVPGIQTAHVIDSVGSTYMTATGGKCIAVGCPQFIYNMNYQVIPFVVGQNEGTCSDFSTDVYVPPSIWTDPNPTVQCIPPCGLILPPLLLGYTTTIDWPLYTTSVWSSSAGNTFTKTTIITIPAVTTTAVPFWRISVQSTETVAETFNPIQSIMPPSMVLTLPATEATFMPVPSGSPQSPPSFYQAPHPITVQPQATVSISISSPTIPDVTYSSAAPTAVCVTGCGTDSCAQFGGCSDSSSGDNDCGTYGCNGGCGVQGCDTTCGLDCSTTIAPATGDYDHGGDDGYDTTAWPDDPTRVIDDGNQESPPHQISDPTTVQNTQSSIESTIANTISIVNLWGESPFDTTLANNANRACTDSYNIVVATFKLFSSGAEGDVDTPYSLMIQALSDAGGPSLRPTLNSEAVEETLQLLDQATEYAESYISQLYEETYESECSIAKRSWRSLRQRAECGGAPTYEGAIESPTNFEDVPEEAGCQSRNGYNIHPRAAILGALEQGIRYLMSNQVSTLASYPHVFNNLEQIDLNVCDQTAAPMYEFPVRLSGIPLAAGPGRSARNANVGNDRVLFQFNQDTGESVYCGTMTHDNVDDESFIPCQPVV